MAKKFYQSFEVCKCMHVSLGELVHAIKDKNARTLDEIATLTDAGSSCKCCIEEKQDIGVEKKELYLTQILNKFKEV